MIEKWAHNVTAIPSRTPVACLNREYIQYQTIINMKKSIFKRIWSLPTSYLNTIRNERTVLFCNRLNFVLKSLWINWSIMFTKVKEIIIPQFRRFTLSLMMKNSYCKQPKRTVIGNPNMRVVFIDMNILNKLNSIT